MGKRRDWTYTEAPGCKVGLMKCCSCGKKITEGEYRYFETEDAYIPQCKPCGGSDSRWVERDRQIAAVARKQWEEDAKTDHVTLLARIKDAFFEGFNDNSGDNHREEAWEYSHAKRVHDTLKELWSIQ